MELYNEKKNNRIGGSVAIGVHVVLVLIFFVFTCGGPPPPYKVDMIGVTIAFGVPTEDSGEPEIAEEEESTPVENEEIPEEDAETPEEEVIPVETQENDLDANVEKVDNEEAEKINKKRLEELEKKRKLEVFKERLAEQERNRKEAKRIADSVAGVEDGATHEEHGDNGFIVNGWSWPKDPDWSGIGDGTIEICFDIDEFGEAGNFSSNVNSFSPTDKNKIYKIIHSINFEKVGSGDVVAKERVCGKLTLKGQ